ncbi:MAG: hypothetical protein JW843_04740 [Candidatus Aminicenantes bacterium]|nr:hypothetical protein [Candidatus Aminicenantes bacterium]
MLEAEIIRLINQESDGTNSAEESRTLARILAGNNEAKTYTAELSETIELLRTAPVPDPGPFFKMKILAFLQRPGIPENDFVKKRGIPAPLFEPIKLKYALFFCLGLGLGLGLLLVSKFGVVKDSGWDLRQLAGTVMDAESLSPMETAGWESTGIEQTVDVLRGERMLAVGLRGLTEREVLVTLSFSPEEMRFDTIRRLSGETGGVEIMPGKIVVRVSGSHGFLVVFRTPGHPPTALDVQANADGEMLFSRSFAWPVRKEHQIGMNEGKK